MSPTRGGVVSVDFTANTGRLIAVLEAISRHADALASELRGLMAEPGPELHGDEPLIDPDCRDGKHAPTCVGDPCACDCHEAGSEAL